MCRREAWRTAAMDRAGRAMAAHRTVAAQAATQPSPPRTQAAAGPAGAVRDPVRAARPGILARWSSAIRPAWCQDLRRGQAGRNQGRRHCRHPCSRIMLHDRAGSTAIACPSTTSTSSRRRGVTRSRREVLAVLLVDFLYEFLFPRIEALAIYEVPYAIGAFLQNVGLTRHGA